MANYLTDTFTGSNGSSWNSSNWTITSGGTCDQQSGRGRISPTTSAPVVVGVVPTVPADFTFTGQFELPLNSSQFVVHYRFNSGKTIGYRLIFLYDTILLYSDNGGTSTLIGYQGGLKLAYDGYAVSFASGAGTPTPVAGQFVQYDDDSGSQSQGVVDTFIGSSSTGTVRFICYNSQGLPSITTAFGNGTSIAKIPSVTWTASMNSIINGFSLFNFRLEVSGTTHKFRYWRKYDASGAIATEPSTWTFNLTDTVSTTQVAPIELKFSDPGGATSGFLDNVSIDSVASSGPTGTATNTLGNATSSASGTTTPTGTSARTLAGATSNGTGTTTPTGTSARTLAGVTSSAAGSSGSTPTGIATNTLANATSSASGTATNGGTAANTLAGVTSSASGTATNGGTAANTLANATSSASGTLTWSGTSARTLAGVTSSGTGTTTLTGTSARTLAGATSTGTGSLTFSGTASQLLGSLISNGSGTVAVNYSVQAKVAVEIRGVLVDIAARGVLVAVAVNPS